MEEKRELDLNNPIFVFYVNTTNLTRHSTEEYLQRIKKTFDIYQNITFWVIASDRTNIECVYDGKYRNRDTEINNIIKEINNRIDIMSKSCSFEDFKINIRDWRINELIDSEKE